MSLTGTFFQHTKGRRALFAALVAGSLAFAHATPSQAAIGGITGNQVTTATVETIDVADGELLLRDKGNGLITLDIPKGAHNLPHLQPGDVIRLRLFQTIEADFAMPDTPPPESTVTSARGYANRHPHGTLVAFHRQRVKVVSVDAAQHVLTTSDESGAIRTVTVRQKSLVPQLAKLKAGDELDITAMEAATFTVLNRTVSPDVSVQETGVPAAAPTTAPAPAPAAADAPKATMDH